MRRVQGVKRIVDIDEYMAQAEGLLAAGERICVPVTGGSMSPFLVGGRDHVLLQAPPKTVARGDMALFRRKDGGYVLHRVIRVCEDGLYLVGDGQRELEGPVAPEQVLAVATNACRKGRWIGRGDFWWDFFAGAWLTLLPLRTGLRRRARIIPKRWR